MPINPLGPILNKMRGTEGVAPGSDVPKQKMVCVHSAGPMSNVLASQKYVQVSSSGVALLKDIDRQL